MDDCDIWEGHIRRDGYGYLHIATINGKRCKVRSHRLIWMQTHGHTDLMVLHSCDTPLCINIDHLRTGTCQDNSDDKMERGRDRNGRAEWTHCKQGHEFTEENTYNGRQRRCVKCTRTRALARYYRIKERNYKEQEII